MRTFCTSMRTIDSGYITSEALLAWGLKVLTVLFECPLLDETIARKIETIFFEPSLAKDFSS